MKRTNRILVKLLSVFMAFALQVMPLIRSALTNLNQALAPNGWAVVFRWAAGAAVLGYDAVSKASSIAISPPNATVGQTYIGTVTYSGGHAGSVSSMSLSNFCLIASTNFVDGLSIVYSGGNTAAVSGTPTNAGTFAFTLKIYDGACGGGNSDTRSTSLVVGTGGGGGVAPVITSPPQGVTAQIGADALLSAGASGNPAPTYYWYRGIPNIATNLVGVGASLDFPSAQLTNSGLYTVVASNATASVSAPAYLSVALTPGTNQLALNYTNYYPSGQALTMFSYLTNVLTASNVYKWQFNSVDVNAYTTNGNNFSLTGVQVTPAKSGKYAVVFNSVVGATTVVDQQLYYSFWAFGLPPTFTNAPQTTNISSGLDVTLSVAVTNNSVPASTPQLPFYGTNTPLTFLWYFNSTNLLVTQTTNGLIASENLVLHAATSANQGDYTVVVSNYWGSVTSAPATLTVTSSGSPPGIATEPTPLAVLAGQNAAFNVVASGTGPLSYQWMRNSAALTNDNVYSGVNTNVLTLTRVSAANAGTYSVIVSNSVSSTNSLGVPLDVQSPPALSASHGPNGLQITANTVVGLTYVVLSATNLNSTWTPVITNTVPANGLLSFTNSVSGPNQFLKLQFP
jgi:Ig-like domain-containing protein